MIKNIFFWGGFAAIIGVLISVNNSPNSNDSSANKDALGLVYKKQITKNIVETATVWEEKHRVKGGVITHRTSVNEDSPGRFSTNIDVKHENLNGKTIYSRIASTYSNSITIYRRGENGFANGKEGATELIDFKDKPSEECLKNHYPLLDVSKACKATVKILSNGNTLRLRFNWLVASIFDAHGKRIRTIKVSDPDFLNVVGTHIKQIYRDTKVVKPLEEPIF